MSNIAISVNNISKAYRIGARQERYKTLRDSIAGALRSTRNRAKKHDTIWALKNVSVEIQPGEVVGIIGRNGAGKSTLLKILSRITEPSTGRARIYGRVGSLLEVGTGFHPELTGRDNVYLNGAILGMRRAEIASRFDEIVAFAEVERFIDTPVKHYSSGMYLRLAFAVAAHLEPEILLVDEVLAVGDDIFQTKCLGKMGEIGKQGRTVVLISHNMTAISMLCQKVIHFADGSVANIGAPGEVVSNYLAPRSQTDFDHCDLPEDDTFRLDRLKVRQDGQERTSFLTRLPLQIVLEYSVKVPLRNLRVGFDFLTADGTVVWRSFDNDWPPDQPRATAPGRYRATCEIPANLLYPTRYIASISIGIDQVRWITKEVLQIPITMHNVNGVNCGFTNEGRRPGVLLPALNWHTARL